MPHEADEILEIRQWLTKATHDRAVAGQIIRAGGVEADVAAFHCQQAVEKLLKAALFFVGGEPPRTHHLARLEALLAEAGQPLPTALQPLLDLTPFAVQWRYEADPGPPMGLGERRSLLADIQQLRKWAEGLLPTERAPE